MALKIVMEDMAPSEIAAMYQCGEDAVIMVSRHLSDDMRCEAVNDLLTHVKARQLEPGILRRLLTRVA